MLSTGLIGIVGAASATAGFKYKGVHGAYTRAVYPLNNNSTAGARDKSHVFLLFIKIKN